MSRECGICGKRTVFGNSVSKSHIKTARVWRPNLVNMTVLISGKPQRIRVCTQCIRSDYFAKQVRIPHSETQK